MILAYWETTGGTLVEEFQLVSGDLECGPRRADAVIVLGANRVRLPTGERAVSLAGKDVIVVQAKASRLGMYLMGQGIFSAELLKRFGPKSIRSVILCTKDDAVLRPLLKPYSNVEVVVLEEFAIQQARPPIK